MPRIKYHDSHYAHAETGSKEKIKRVHFGLGLKSLGAAHDVSFWHLSQMAVQYPTGHGTGWHPCFRAQGGQMLFSSVILLAADLKVFV